MSLRTPRAIAEVKASEVERELVRSQLALVGGLGPAARSRYDEAVAYAHVRRVAYRSASELAEGPLEELVARLFRVLATGQLREKAAINAELAGEERPAFSLTGALEVFLVETGDRRAGMSAAQVKKWEAPQRRAVDEFVALRGDKPLAEFRPDIAVAFRTMRRQRLENGKAVPKTAKRSIGHRSDRFKSVVEMRQFGLKDTFAKLKLRNGPERR